MALQVDRLPTYFEIQHQVHHGAQSDALTAIAMSDLNANGTNPRLLQLQRVHGIMLQGSGRVVGDFSIDLTNRALD